MISLIELNRKQTDGSAPNEIDQNSKPDHVTGFVNLQESLIEFIQGFKLSALKDYI